MIVSSSPREYVDSDRFHVVVVTKWWVEESLCQGRRQSPTLTLRAHNIDDFRINSFFDRRSFGIGGRCVNDTDRV
jgi:hypothetical protein